MKFLEKSRKRLNQPLIFVCSPYRGDVNAHVKCARRYCRYVVKQGGIPFAPLHVNRRQEAANQCDNGMTPWKGEAQ